MFVVTPCGRTSCFCAGKVDTSELGPRQVLMNLPPYVLAATNIHLVSYLLL